MEKTNLNIVRQVAEFIPFNPVIYTRLAMVNRDFYVVFTSDSLWRRYDFYSVKKGIYEDFLRRVRGIEELMRLSWHDGFRNPLFTSILPELKLKVDNVDNLFVKFGFAANCPTPACIKGAVYINESMYFALMDLVLKRDDFIATLGSDSILDGTASICTLQFYENCPGTTRDGKRCPHELLKTRVPQICANTEKLRKVFHSLVLHPWIIPLVCDPIQDAYNKQLNEFLQDLKVDRDALLSFIDGVPELLELMPEYWQDQEFCLKALHCIPLKHRYEKPFKFLVNCKDPVVIVEAIEAIPFTEYPVFPKCLLQDRDMFLRAMLSISPKVRSGWFDDIECQDSPFWADPDILATLFDRPYITPEGQLAYPITTHGPDELQSLTDNYDWMIQRAIAHPTCYAMGSSRLKQQREILVQALSNGIESRIETSVPVKTSEYKASGLSLPDRFHNDEEIVKLAVMASGITAIPTKMWNEELIRSHVKSGFGCTGVFNQSNTKYRWARAAVLQDIRAIGSFLWALQAFAADPTISPYLCERIHDVYFLIACRAEEEKLFRRAFDTLVRDKSHMRNKVDPRTAARLFRYNVGVYEECNLPVGIDMASALMRLTAEMPARPEWSVSPQSNTYRYPTVSKSYRGIN